MHTTLTTLLCLIFLQSCHKAQNIKIQKTVRTVSGKDYNCQVFHFKNEETNPAKTLFLVWGTGLYSVGEGDFNGEVKELLDKGEISILMFDKPGIYYDEDKSGEGKSFYVKYEEFSKYTFDDLLSCAQSSLNWHQENYKGQEIILQGHSEGTVVVGLLYKKLLEQKDPLVSKISKILLSGTSMIPLSEEVSAQFQAFYPQGLAEKLHSRYKEAITQGDDLLLISWGALNSHYLKNIENQEPLLEVLKKLAPLRPQARFYMFQGEQDKNTPTKYVKDFQKWNETSPQDSRLNLQVFYYQAGHSLNEAASKDIKKVISH